MLAMAACGKEPNPSSDVSGGTGESTASTSADTGPSADSTETAAPPHLLLRKNSAITAADKSGRNKTKLN